MAPHSKYIKAERALNAVATLSCKKPLARGDDAMSRSTSAKSILRVERFLSLSGIDAHLELEQNLKMLCFFALMTDE